MDSGGEGLREPIQRSSMRLANAILLGHMASVRPTLEPLLDWRRRFETYSTSQKKRTVITCTIGTFVITNSVIAVNVNTKRYWNVVKPSLPYRRLLTPIQMTVGAYQDQCEAMDPRCKGFVYKKYWTQAQAETTIYIEATRRWRER